MRRGLAASIAIVCALAPIVSSRAQTAPSPSPSSSSSSPSSSPSSSSSSDGCVENVPSGATRPTLVEKLPPHARAGEGFDLEIAVHHASGETATLPAEIFAALAKGDLRLANADGFSRSAPPIAVADPGDKSRATTLLKVPLVVLSKEQHRKAFTLPALRVVVLRRGGGDLWVCTSPHTIEIDQPIASTPHPTVRPGPPDVPQITRNERLQTIVTWASIGLLAGALAMAGWIWLQRRPKPPEPPPPPPDPLEVARAAIMSARREFLDASAALKSRDALPSAWGAPTKLFYDRLSDAVRAYLGARYGFDGLDCTTDEMIARLQRHRSPALPRERVREFLYECDLVKFAGMSATQDEAIATARAADELVNLVATSGMTGLRSVDLRPPSSRFPPASVPEGASTATNAETTATTTTTNAEATTTSDEEPKS
ncbi:MAG: hypothetical protein ACHREM_17875 [Polyangiales bacterium]